MTSSNVLFEKVRLERPDVMFIPNGVDLEHFNPERVAVSAELKAIEEPVVGFHGAIAEWVDYKLLEEVLDLRPQYQFVFVGPVSQPKDFARVLARRNARHIDTKVYELVPGYIAGFKVGIVPFLMNDVTRGCPASQGSRIHGHGEADSGHTLARHHALAGRSLRYDSGNVCGEDR